ncbi:MAG: hypothetical protein WCL00_01690 [Bacteroidota bacterium]
MDSQKVDMFLMTNGKFFDTFHLQAIRERLLQMDDSKFFMLHSIGFKDPTVFAKLAADINHGTPRVLPVIPIGAGVEFPLSQKLFLTTEASYRLTLSDYIDGFSIAADPNKKDHYYI